MATFVLVHGGCHGGWCWERITPLLERMGHKVLAPDLPGAGDDKTPLREVTLESRGGFVADLIRRQSEPVILVGHSLGGTVISHVTETVPERLKAVVYLAAFMVRDGESMWDSSNRTPHELPELILSEDGLTNVIGKSSLAPFFYGTTPKEWADRAASKVGSEATGLMNTPVRLTPERFGRVPRYYIETLQDRAISITQQRLMQKDWPCRKVFTLDTDHSPFYCAPEQLAENLNAVARDAAP